MAAHKTSQHAENANTLQPVKVAIIGAGLVGALAALNLARKNFEVHLYEYREDIRHQELAHGRSINLALSHRGRHALAEVGLEEEVLSAAIPMHGRMLHDVKGDTSVMLYDPCKHQCLHSVGRKQLNEIILTAGERYPNLYRHFGHKLITANFKEGRMEFTHASMEQKTRAQADLIIGCDGAFSAVRQQMLKMPGFNFRQEYIEHGYLELCIPAKDGEFQMPENYLHIWPRDLFMMIALPNQDKSFTVTLSMPFRIFESIKNADDLLNFFKKYYPDAVPMIGKDELVKDFFKSKPQHLISVKCNPYNFGSRALLLGDAAHAMVPYYGQGMNAGMEDCTLLMSILSQPGITIGAALEQFTMSRWEDAHAICDLAMYNYVEMRDLTKRLSFRYRKWLDNILFRLLSNAWVPLYNSVSFSRMPYKKCLKNKEWQDKVLKRSLYTVTVSCVISGIAVILAKVMHIH